MGAKVDSLGAAVQTLSDGQWDRRDVSALVTIVGAAGSLLMSGAAVALLVMQMVGAAPVDESPAPAPAADTDAGSTGGTDTDR